MRNANVKEPRTSARQNASVHDGIWTGYLYIMGAPIQISKPPIHRLPQRHPRPIEDRRPVLDLVSGLELTGLARVCTDPRSWHGPGSNSAGFTSCVNLRSAGGYFNKTAIGNHGIGSDLHGP